MDMDVILLFVRYSCTTYWINSSSCMGSGVSKNSAEKTSKMSENSLRALLLEKTTEIQQLKSECDR